MAPASRSAAVQSPATRAPNNGGGIYSVEPASIEGTSITGNTANNGSGGGIYSAAPLTLTSVQLGTVARPNVAESGGGLFTQNTGATIVRSTIARNAARNAGRGLGGGILNALQADDELRQTTVTDNSSDHIGGGIVNYGATMTILTSTISGNQILTEDPRLSAAASRTRRFRQPRIRPPSGWSMTR
jgi:predicted outer membrane repeat protein